MSEEVRISWGDKVAQRYESNQGLLRFYPSWWRSFLNGDSNKSYRM